jgi:hypothetical protein
MLAWIAGNGNGIYSSSLPVTTNILSSYPETFGLVPACLGPVFVDRHVRTERNV